VEGAAGPRTPATSATPAAQRAQGGHGDDRGAPQRLRPVARFITDECLVTPHGYVAIDLYPRWQTWAYRGRRTDDADGSARRWTARATRPTEPHTAHGSGAAPAHRRRECDGDV
jgi:hypothetical protein